VRVPVRTPCCLSMSEERKESEEREEREREEREKRM
jgi:hypothetical protein